VSPALRPLRALAHPAWGAALALLLLNDHVLKGAGVLPGWLTGKLSDFAGLFVAGVLLAALLAARGSARVAFAQLTVGVGFAAFKLFPALAVVGETAYRLVGLEWRLVNDATDLLALPMLVLAYLHTVRAGRESARSTPGARVVVARGLAALGLLACIASEAPNTPMPTTEPLPCGGDNQDCDMDGYSAPADCNDADPSIRPGNGCPDLDGELVCDDGLDDDADGDFDCQDKDCKFACADLEAACASKSGLVDFATVGVLKGSTAMGTSVTSGECAGADAPEVIFIGQSSQSGVLSINVPAGHAVHVRRECDEEFSELACNDGSLPGAVVEVPMSSVSLTIVFEAIDPLQAGPFEAAVTVHPVGCGDGTRTGTEQCDDGNWIAGDGCDSACQAETGPLCAAAETLEIGATDGDFVGAPRSFVGVCAGSFDTLDRVYRYVATTTSVTVSVASLADVSLYANSGGCPGTKAEGCVEKKGAGQGESLTLVTTPGEELYFFVELAPQQPEDAVFTLTLTDP